MLCLCNEKRESWITASNPSRLCLFHNVRTLVDQFRRSYLVYDFSCLLQRNMARLSNEAKVSVNLEIYKRNVKCKTMNRTWRGRNSTEWRTTINEHRKWTTGKFNNSGRATNIFNTNTISVQFSVKVGLQFPHKCTQLSDIYHSWRRLCHSCGSNFGRNYAGRLSFPCLHPLIKLVCNLM